MTSLLGSPDKKLDDNVLLNKMDQKTIIQKTADHVKQELLGEGSGYDWWHVRRVWQNAKHIGQVEGVDMFAVELAALLHDIADWKLHGGDETIGPKVAGDWMTSLQVSKQVIDRVQQIIATMSFKGAGVKSEMRTIEGKVVQDADRLGALGAIGVGRAFAYGGFKH